MCEDNLSAKMEALTNVLLVENKTIKHARYFGHN